MALNGVSEAFTHAVMSAEEAAAHSRRLVALSGVFAAVALVTIRSLGTRGIIIANAVNLTLRVGFAARQVRSGSAHPLLARPTAL